MSRVMACEAQARVCADVILRDSGRYFRSGLPNALPYFTVSDSKDKLQLDWRCMVGGYCRFSRSQDSDED